MVVLAMILGCLLGFSFAYMIIAILAQRSNDHGDSKGTFSHFNEMPLHITKQQDEIRKPE